MTKHALQIIFTAKIIKSLLTSETTVDIWGKMLAKNTDFSSSVPFLPISGPLYGGEDGHFGPLTRDAVQTIG